MTCGCMLKDTEKMFQEVAFKETPLTFGELTTADINYLNSNFLRLDTFNLYVTSAGEAAEADYDRLRSIIQGTAGVLQGKITDLRTYVDTTFRQIGSDVGALRTTEDILAEEILALQEFTGFGSGAGIPENTTGVGTAPFVDTGECAAGDIFCQIGKSFSGFFNNLGIFSLGAGAGSFIILIILLFFISRRK